MAYSDSVLVVPQAHVQQLVGGPLRVLGGVILAHGSESEDALPNGGDELAVDGDRRGLDALRDD